jgi:hypothetical protein
MTDPQSERFGLRVQTLAAQLTYPPTPAIVDRVSVRLRRPAVFNPVPRRLALAGLVLVLAFLASLAVPQVRATLVDFIQLGAVRIYLIAPTVTPTATPPPTGTPIPTPAPTPTLLPSLLQLTGKTTLAEARTRTGYTIPLPTYPADLGQPDYVFVQTFDQPMVILVWVDPAKPTQVRLSFHIIAPNSYAIGKIEPTIIENTHVNGLPAIWAVGPYVLQTIGNDYDVRRLIDTDSHVLIWPGPERFTYRLETDQSLDEAVKIAESLK